MINIIKELEKEASEWAVENYKYSNSQAPNEMEQVDRFRGFNEKFAVMIIQAVVNEAYDEIQYATSHAIANEIRETLERRFGLLK